jgi:hypothetical protein
MTTVNSPNAMNALLVLDPCDLESLLATDPAELLGRIMRLNRTPRYHNTLNAVDVFQRLIELQQQAALDAKR